MTPDGAKTVKFSRASRNTDYALTFSSIRTKPKTTGGAPVFPKSGKNRDLHEEAPASEKVDLGAY